MRIGNRAWELVVEAKIGQRVQLHPGQDRWMRGDQYGRITGFGWYGGRDTVRVKLDRSGRTFAFHPDRLQIAFS